MSADVTPVPIPVLLGRMEEVSLLVPDNQQRLPSSPYHKKPYEVRITYVRCRWSVSWRGPSPVYSRTFHMGGPRIVKYGEGESTRAEPPISWTPPTWLADLVDPYQPEWYRND